MSEKLSVQFFINIEITGRRAEIILKSARGDSPFAFRHEQRSFFSTPELQIFTDDFTKTVRQHHAAVYSSLFFHPHSTARNIDIFNVRCGQCAGSKSQDAQRHNVGDAPWRDN